MEAAVQSMRGKQDRVVAFANGCLLGAVVLVALGLSAGLLGGNPEWVYGQMGPMGQLITRTAHLGFVLLVAARELARWSPSRRELITATAVCGAVVLSMALVGGAVAHHFGVLERDVFENQKAFLVFGTFVPFRGALGLVLVSLVGRHFLTDRKSFAPSNRLGAPRESAREWDRFLRRAAKTLFVSVLGVYVPAKLFGAVPYTRVVVVIVLASLFAVVCLAVGMLRPSSATDGVEQHKWRRAHAVVGGTVAVLLVMLDVRI